MNCEKCGKPKSENLDYCPTCNAQENNNANNIVVKCQCGQKLEENWKFCPKCNAPINVEIINTNTELTKKDNSQSYIIIFLISIAINFLLNSNIFFLIALITIVSGKINCPNSKAIKILFWLMMLYAIFLLIITMWLLLVCGNGISSCPG